MQSIAKQYGILPSQQEQLHYSEWLLLLGGIMEDTPLGKVVLIRRESDPKQLQNFTRYEHHIRNEWRRFIASQMREADRQSPQKTAAAFEKMMLEMFGKEAGKCLRQ